MTESQTAQDPLVMERSFDAPVSLVWQLWTEPEHFKAWYGPEDATITVAEMDVRVGGTRRVCMEIETPAGQMLMCFSGEYREVVVNERLAYTESLADGPGNPMPSPGGSDGHPATTLVTVTFTESAGRTSIVLTHEGIPADSPGATGWAMALDKLARYVNRRIRR